MLNVGQVIDTMHAGLLRMGRWIAGAGLAALVAFAHAQPAFAGHGGGGFHGGFPSAPMMHEAPRAAMPMQWGGQRDGARRGSYGGAPNERYGAGPMRVADQGGWHGRQGGHEAQQRRGGGFSGSSYGNPYGNGFGGGYHGPIQPVSAEARQVPHPPADSPVRAGSIREDVARYNEERSTFRPFPRNSGDVPRPPMPAPYRN